MRFALTLSAMLAGLAAASAASAGDRLAVGAGVGTTGVNAAVQYRATDRLVLRGSADWLKYDHEVESDDVAYAGELDSALVGATAEFHPWSNGFFVGAGAAFGDRIVHLDARPTGPVTIGGRTFTPAEVGRLEGEADLGGTAPVLGVGYDNTFRTDGRLGFRLVAGVAFGQEPTVHLRSVDGTYSNDPALQAELAEEEAQIEEDLEALRYYPVLQAGLTWRF